MRNNEALSTWMLDEIPERAAYCTSSIASASTLSASDVGEMSFHLDLHDLPGQALVLEHTTALGILLGPSLDKRTDLLQWMTPSGKDAFIAAAQTLSNRNYYHDGTPIDDEIVELQIHPPQLKQHRLFLCTKISMAIVGHTDSAPQGIRDVSDVLVKVTFERTSWKQKGNTRTLSNKGTTANSRHARRTGTSTTIRL